MTRSSWLRGLYGEQRSFVAPVVHAVRQCQHNRGAADLDEWLRRYSTRCRPERLGVPALDPDDGDDLDLYLLTGEIAATLRHLC